MNREILYRGKDAETREWIFGGYYWQKIFTGLKSQCSNKRVTIKIHYIIEDLTFDEVIPNTVGVFTNQYDKFKSKIFENDILKMWLEDSVEPEGGFFCYMFVKLTIEKGFVLWGKHMTIDDAIPLYQMLQENDMEVVGTVHDNPDFFNKTKN